MLKRLSPKLNTVVKFTRYFPQISKIFSRFTMQLQYLKEFSICTGLYYYLLKGLNPGSKSK